MSGGQWDYCGSKIKHALQEVAEEDIVLNRFPVLAKVLYSLGDILYDIEHDLDWDICDDSYIEDDRKWEEEMLKQLEKVIGGGEYERPSL